MWANMLKGPWRRSKIVESAQFQRMPQQASTGQQGCLWFSRVHVSLLGLCCLVLAQLAAPAWAGAQARGITAGAAANTIETPPPKDSSDFTDANEDLSLDFAKGVTLWAVDQPYTEAELQGTGCLVLGSVGVLMAYLINTDEYLMIAAGGTLASSSPAVVVLALFSTVAASGCAVGAIATPALMRWYRDIKHFATEGSDLPLLNFADMSSLRWR